MNIDVEHFDEMTVISDGPVILTIPINPEAIYILYVFTPIKARGQGLMKAMFDKYLAEADKNEKNLFMTFKPDAGTDQKRLKKFYQSRGFEFGKDDYAVRQFKTSLS